MRSERGLASGTIIYDSYVVEQVLGEGGFGITYLAHRKDNGERVAVKEYFPISIAVRQKESNQIAVSEQEQGEYIQGKERFMKEAAILKEYRYLQGIVRVRDCFETNDTAYIIMDYIDGVTLKEYISCHGRLDYAEWMEMLTPILKSLITLHRHGVIHRDISPDNLMIGMDNQLYLIDFGAAKEMEYGKTTTVLLKAGYAPPEQYLHDGELGAWTDVYALCATIYTALCGKIPTDAVARLQGKPLIPLSEQGVILEEWQWEAVSKGMSMRSAERFRDVGELYDALTVPPSEEDILTVIEPEMEPFLQKEMHQLNEGEKTKPHATRKRFLLGVAAVAVLVLLCGAYYGSSVWMKRNRQNVSASVENGAGMPQEDTVDTESQTEQNMTTEETMPKLCKMPNVVGMGKDEAMAEIHNIDETINVRIVRSYNKDVDLDVVIQQSVEPDTQYNEGGISEIVLTVSDGEESTTESKTTAPASKQKKQSTKDDYFNVESDGNELVEFYLDD
ncbi:MAG: serine/threonine-protein kinase [Clostridiales bacterium]|nr:serine/threonine-protein kinase [Clostridiales bacterium]